jgi:hypothetical protein
MTHIARGTLLTFDPATWLAMVLLDGADTEAQIPVAQGIDPGSLVVDANLAVLIFDGGGTNTDDACVVGVYGAVGGSPVYTKVSPGVANSWLKNYRIQSLANNGQAALLSDNLAALGWVIVINFNDATGAMFQLRGATHTTQLLLDPIGVFSNTAGTAAKTNAYWSAGNTRYEIENKTGGVRSYDVLYFGE